MKINILNVGLAEFFDRKCDIVYGLYHALNDLGHQVTITHNVIERSALNLLVGSDILCGDLDLVKLMTSSGVDYAVYEVENFNGQTINYQSNNFFCHGQNFYFTCRSRAKCLDINGENVGFY